MGSFHSTPDYPCPSMLPCGEPNDDIAAVVAGSKQAALIYTPYEVDSNGTVTEVCDPIYEALIEIAKESGYHVGYLKESVYVGPHNIVNQLMRLHEVKTKTVEERIDRCQKVGRLLGYSEEAVYDFVEYGIKQNMDYQERRMRRVLCNG